MYTAVGLGEGGKNPPSKKSFKYRGKDGVVAPLSALDEVAWNLAEFRKNAEDRADTNDILIMLETEANREDLLRKVRSYKPLVQSTKKMGFTFFTFGLLDDSDSRNDDTGLVHFSFPFFMVGIPISRRNCSRSYRQ